MNNYYPPFVQALKETDPAMYRIVTDKFDLVMGAGELDQKTKLLIALAVDSYAGSTGVNGIANAARKAGASENEITEALRIAYHIAGNKVLASSSLAFE